METAICILALTVPNPPLMQELVQQQHHSSSQWHIRGAEQYDGSVRFCLRSNHTINRIVATSGSSKSFLLYTLKAYPYGLLGLAERTVRTTHSCSCVLVSVFHCTAISRCPHVWKLISSNLLFAVLQFFMLRTYADSHSNINAHRRIQFNQITSVSNGTFSGLSMLQTL